MQEFGVQTAHFASQSALVHHDTDIVNFVLFRFQYSSISEVDLVSLQQRYEEHLTMLRPNAVGLVDAFELRDEVRSRPV